MAKPSVNFYEFGFNKITPDLTIHNVCDQGKITLNYNTEIKPILLIDFLKNSNELKIVSFQKNNGWIWN